MNKSDKQNIIAELEVMLREAKVKHSQAHEEALFHFGIVNYLEKEINARKETLKKEEEKEAYDVKVAIEEPTINWATEEQSDKEEVRIHKGSILR